MSQYAEMECSVETAEHKAKPDCPLDTIGPVHHGLLGILANSVGGPWTNCETSFEAEKDLSGALDWFEVDNAWLSLKCPLEIGGATVPGLRLTATAHKYLPDESVSFQLEFRATHGKMMRRSV